ncbi:methyltransferase domain-containing protein [Streptomyces cuspidosporus]|uniref:Methyltransferase domain-containing protein n=1 Tax=Streptomyces cuspidosporus TaxID=66882 RepID=A0ABN3H977_9ACTN
MRRDMGEHYQNLASTYDDNWAYSPDFVEWMSQRIAAALRLTADDRMADVGCGTGLFAKGIADALRPRHRVLCVDPSAAMLEQLDGSPDLLPILWVPESMSPRLTCWFEFARARVAASCSGATCGAW